MKQQDNFLRNKVYARLFLSGSQKESFLMNEYNKADEYNKWVKIQRNAKVLSKISSIILVFLCSIMLICLLLILGVYGWGIAALYIAVWGERAKWLVQPAENIIMCAGVIFLPTVILFLLSYGRYRHSNKEINAILGAACEGKDQQNNAVKL